MQNIKTSYYKQNSTSKSSLSQVHVLTSGAILTMLHFVFQFFLKVLKIQFLIAVKTKGILDKKVRKAPNQLELGVTFSSALLNSAQISGKSNQSSGALMPSFSLLKTIDTGTIAKQSWAKIDRFG